MLRGQNYNTIRGKNTQIKKITPNVKDQNTIMKQMKFFSKFGKVDRYFFPMFGIEYFANSLGVGNNFSLIRVVFRIYLWQLFCPH